MVTSVWAGIHIGAWTNFYVGNLTPYPHPPPYEIIWPNIYMLGKLHSDILTHEIK